MPKVSVIVPVYKVEKYLHRCVDSILAQTFRDFELILVDDGSPDGCGAICDEYAAKDSRVRVIHQENRGVSAARNAGLDASKGEYIAFVDSDDYVEADFLHTLYVGLLEAKVDMIVSNFRMVDEEGVLLRVVSHDVDSTQIDSGEMTVEYMLTGILGGKYGWELWTRMFRRDIIERHNIRFCTSCSNYAEDLGFVLSYSLFSKACCSIGYCGYAYLVREHSMMRSSAVVAKLDQVNEISVQFGATFNCEITDEALRKNYALIHFLIMLPEYRKLVGTPYYHTLPEEIAKITQKSWFYRKTKEIWKCFSKMKALYGKKTAQQILLLSHFCAHGNWKRFQYESAIAYKFFIRG